MSACKDCDENKKQPCTKCKKDVCRCKRPKEICYEDGCKTKVPAECVIYKPQGGTSYLECFLGIGAKTNLEEILETLDDKLCDAFTLNLPSCIVDKIGLTDREVDYKVFLSKLATYICTNEDKYVKVSPSDTKPGYLTDKISTGECMDKRIVTDGNGVEKLEIFLNFECLKTKIGDVGCMEVNCCDGGDCSGGGSSNYFSFTTNTTSICGSNKATLSIQTNRFCASLNWYRNDVLISSGVTTSLDVSQAGTYHVICKDAQGNNVSISNSIVITHIGACPCVSTVWTPTGNTRCQDGVSQIERRSNCNVYEWIPGGDACNEPCNPVWTDKKPLEIYCGGIVNTMTGSTHYDKCILYQAFSNQCNADIMWYPYPKNPDGSACTDCGGGCTSSGTHTSSVSGNVIIFRDSCNTEVGRFTIGTPEKLCSGTGEERITVGVTPSSGVTLSDYSISYSLAGATTRPSQGSNTFNDVNIGSHTVTVSIFRIGQAGTTTRSVNGTINVTPCSETCTDPLATLSIVANKSVICANESTSLTLTATKNGCPTVTWIRKQTPASAEEIIGSGDTLTIADAQGGLYSARCFNCAGTAFSNEVAVTRSEDCAPCVPNWIDTGLEYCEGNDLVINQQEMCGLEPTGATRVRVIEANSNHCIAQGHYFRLVSCATGNYFYTTDDLSGVPSGRILTEGGNRYQFDGHDFTSGTVPTPIVNGLSVTSDTECDTGPDPQTYWRLTHCENSATPYFTSTDLSGESAGRVVIQGAHYYQYDGITHTGVEPAGYIGGVTISGLTECPSSCTDPEPTISITTSATEICGGNTVTLNSTSNMCTQINWYRAEFATPTAWAFFAMNGGASTTTTQEGRYQAQCVNCNGSSHSNIIEITQCGGGDCDCPDTVQIFGTFSPTAGSTQTYNASIAGGSGFVVNWAVNNGTINGSSTGTTVSVTWSSTPGEGTISCTPFCDEEPCSTASLEVVTIS